MPFNVEILKADKAINQYLLRLFAAHKILSNIFDENGVTKQSTRVRKRALEIGWNFIDQGNN